MACSGKKAKKGKSGGGKRRNVFIMLGDWITGPLDKIFLIMFEG